MGIPDHLTCLLKNLYVGQEATIRILYGKTDWFKIEKGIWQSCLLSLCLFNLYAEHIMRNARLDELQARIKIGGRDINNLRYTDDTTLMVETKEELQTLLMRVKEESQRATSKLNIRKIKIMVSNLITSWQVEGERWKWWQISSSLALKSLQMVTAAMKSEDDCFLSGKQWQT